MNVAKLIALAAKKALEEHPTAIGVRLSPISVSAGDLAHLPSELKEILGPSVYVAASAPGAKRQASGRVFVSEGQDAAERATAWRNEVRVPHGERLVYVSVEEHGKASGLKDCLLAVPESDLVDALFQWLSSPESGLPEGFADALREADLIESRSLSMLLEFAKQAQTAKGPSKDWRHMGRHLPALNLLKDSGLKESGAADRLRANHRLVAIALTGEARRRSESGPLVDLEADLYRALHSAPPSARQGLLAEFDIGQVGTKSLGPKPKKKAKRPAQPAAPEPPPAPKGPARPGRGKDRASSESKAEQVEQAEQPTSYSRPTQPDDSQVKQPPAGPYRSKDQAPDATHHIRVPRLPAGLAALLHELHKGPGTPVQLNVKSEPRQCLAEVPAIAECKQAFDEKLLKERLKGRFSRWSEARLALLKKVEQHGRKPEDAGALLAGALGSLTANAEISSAVEELEAAAADLYNAAAEQDSALQRQVLTLDTIEIQERGGTALRLLGPLHLLWLSQTSARHKTLAAAEGLPETTRLLISRAMSAAPTAPASFPESGRDELRLAPAEAGLIVYERAPDATLGAPVKGLLDALATRYLSLCPYAASGLRVALLGGDEEAALEGLGLVLERDEEIGWIEALCSKPPRIPSNSPVGRLFESGRLRVGSVPSDLEKLTESKPHLVLHFRGEPTKPDQEEPAPPSVTTFAPLGATTFEVRQNGLRVWTSLAGSQGALVFDRLHSAVRGRKAQGFFVSDHTALALKSALPQATEPSVTWHAVVAPSIGKKPPLGFHLVAHETVADAQCAVIARDLRPLYRDIQDALKSLGIDAVQPSKLKTLSDRLSSRTTTPRLSLSRVGSEQLLAGVLALELNRLGGSHGVVIPIESASLALLSPRRVPAGAGVFMLALRAVQGKLSGQFGFASALPALDLDLTKATPAGELGRQLGVLSEIWSLAASDKGPGGVFAREWLSWLIWPALLAEDGGPDEVRSALKSWLLSEATEHPLLLLSTKFLEGASVAKKKAHFNAVRLDPNQLSKMLLG